MFARKSIARLMFVVFTAGIGLVTLRNQSDFWLGVLVAVTATWAILVASDLIASRNRIPRASRSAFLIALSAGLFYGFGPWSDVSKRGAIPEDANGMTRYASDVLPTTIALIRLSHLIGPCRRAEIQTFDRSGRPDIRIVISGNQAFSSGVERLVDDTQRSLDPSMDVMARKYSGPDFVVAANSLAVYFDTCHLLASMLIGCLAELCTAMFARHDSTKLEADRATAEDRWSV
jgi:hypothetical protein